MKRPLLSILAGMLVCGMSMAQNEEIHVFRNDRNINSLKASDIKEIKYQGGTSGYSHMIVNKADGSTLTVSMDVVDSCVLRATGLPEFHVTLNDYPTWTELNTSWGKSYEYSATLRMDGNGMFDDLPEQTVIFRGRGNSTWNMPKKPYRFKMNKKASVCGLKKAKTFALIANFIDGTLMRNAIALWTANYLGLPYSNHCIPVNVYLNGTPKGQYMLTEKIGIGGGSVDIDELKGMLFELDSNYDEDFRFRYYWKSSDGRQRQLPVMVKDPDLTEIAPLIGTTANEYFAKWQDDFTKFADAVVNTPATGSLKDYLDLDAAANFFIVNSLANNHEMKHPKSLYLHKDSIEGVYKFGPVWDFDWAYTFENYRDESASATVPLVSQNGDCNGADFVKALFSNEEFMNLYREKWADFVTNGYPQLKAYIEQYATMIEPSAKENGLIWESQLSSYGLNSYDLRDNLNALKAWLDARVAYCNSHPNCGIF